MIIKMNQAEAMDLAVAALEAKGDPISVAAARVVADVRDGKRQKYRKLTADEQARRTATLDKARAVKAAKEAARKAAEALTAAEAQRMFDAKDRADARRILAPYDEIVRRNGR